MSAQDSHHENLALPNEKKGKRKSRHCDLKSQEGVVCEDEQHGASIPLYFVMETGKHTLKQCFVYGLFFINTNEDTITNCH